jgi:signal transduction histidine kinase
VATHLLAQDKVAYIYDLESSLTATVSEQVAASLSGLESSLRYFAIEISRESHYDAATELFASEPDVLAVEVWRPHRGHFERLHRHADEARMRAPNVSAADLEEASRTTPVPFEAVVAEGLQLQNASLAPDVALLSVAVPAPGGLVTVALVQPGRLLRIFGRAPAYRVYLVDGKGRIVVHPDPQRVIGRESAADAPLVRQAIRGPVARGVHQIDSREGPVIGAFARTSVGRLAVVVEVPREEALRGARLLVRRSLLFGLGIFFAAVLASVFFARRLTAPLARLEGATRAVAAGNFEVAVPTAGDNEIGALGRAFTRMGKELADREARLSDAHLQLSQSEKLSVLGEISASIVHEVRGPLSGIIGYAQAGRDPANAGHEGEHFQLIEDLGWRADEIVRVLLEFARFEQSPLEPVDLNKVVADALRLLKHQLMLHRVQVETRLSSASLLVLGNANQLQQVLANLVLNAAQAMESSPTRLLTVSTSLEGGAVILAVADTGPGMPPAVREKLFTPFFTTKPRGRGTGLGLSVSQRIVQRHRGEISVETSPGQGTTFRVRLPAAGDRGPTPPGGASATGPA